MLKIYIAKLRQKSITSPDAHEFTYKCYLSRSTKGFAKISQGTAKTLMNRS